ncbi:hypothetical protein [Methanothermobacter thermautotrophicus]|nr:hypothetical protein [Methanothermobacter thermautotrophicus]
MELLKRRHEGEYEYRIPFTEDRDRLKGGHKDISNKYNLPQIMLWRIR